MDPSHAKRYDKSEIEAKAAQTLRSAYPRGITVPIDIDLLVECNRCVDHIVPIPSLESKYMIAGVLTVKSTGRFDILVDEDTLDYHRARASFTIAHELGHIILHAEVFVGCKTIDDSLALQMRLKRAYRFLEEGANSFASAVLVPYKHIMDDAATLYQYLVTNGNYETRLDHIQVAATLAKRYGVNTTPMKIRLERLAFSRRSSVHCCTNRPSWTFRSSLPPQSAVHGEVRLSGPISNVGSRVAEGSQSRGLSRLSPNCFASSWTLDTAEKRRPSSAAGAWAK